MRQIVLDTETTGLSPENGDRIIEIGCVELINRKLTGNNLHQYINPERDSDPEALKVHGISNEFLRDKPKFAAIATELLDYLRGAELIIHNAPFDIGFLNKELERLNLGRMDEHVSGVLDTLVMAKELFPGKRNSLDALCSRLEVDNSDRTLHGALLDAELLADVYINMTRGQNALGIDDHAAADDDQAPGLTLTVADLSTYQLTVLQANDAERAAHDAVLADLDKASKGKTLWRKHEPVAASA
ncbi:DNA polymerase III subunit epsilon [Hydrogenophaga soli]